MTIRTGLGIDIHEFTENRKLILGGIEIPFDKGLKGHSDADALIHAICDSMLGALALGDIGKHFPDTDPAYKNAESKIFLYRTKELIQEKGFAISNLDTMIILERPKILNYIPLMQKNIADILELELDQVSIKATTSESRGFTGRGEGIICYANVLLIKSDAK